MTVEAATLALLGQERLGPPQRLSIAGASAHRLAQRCLSRVAALLLRAHRYSSTAHVLPLVLAALAGLLAAAAVQVRATGADASTTLLVLLASGGALTALAAARPGKPARARIRVALERAETAVLLGCGVTALAAFDAYGLAFAIVR